MNGGRRGRLRERYPNQDGGQSIKIGRSDLGDEKSVARTKSAPAASRRRGENGLGVGLNFGVL